MSIHEIAIGNVYMSPILLQAVLALPITLVMIHVIHRFELSKFIWHEMLFAIALYMIIFSIIALISSL